MLTELYVGWSATILYREFRRGGSFFTCGRFFFVDNFAHLIRPLETDELTWILIQWKDAHSVLWYALDVYGVY